MAECKEVIHQLKKRQHTTWSIKLNLLFPDSLLTVLSDINECLVIGLDIVNTPFDSDCVSELVQVVTSSKTIEYLQLVSSPLLPDTYHLLTTTLSSNNTIKSLYLYGDDNITDKDVPQICDIVINNKTLKVLYLTNCPNITEYGIQQIQNVLVYNNSLCELFVNGNYLRF